MMAICSNRLTLKEYYKNSKINYGYHQGNYQSQGGNGCGEWVDVCPIACLWFTFCAVAHFHGPKSTKNNVRFQTLLFQPKLFAISIVSFCPIFAVRIADYWGIHGRSIYR